MIKQEFTKAERECQAEYTQQMTDDFCDILKKYSALIDTDSRVDSSGAVLAATMLLSVSNMIADYTIFHHEKDKEMVKKFFEGVPFCIKANLNQIYKLYVDSLKNDNVPRET
jgi:hypothetical protein